MTAVAAETPAMTAPAPVAATSPYKSLDFYDRDDASNFAGRDQEIDDIAAGVARSRCFVLYGRSGLGKTSLLHAGVIPRLEDRGFEVKYVRILGAPIADLCAAIAAQVGRDALDDGELPAVLADRAKPFVLVLDQFEEFFIRFRGQPEMRARFAALLGKIVDAGAGWVRLVVSAREDYYAELEDLEPQIPALTAQRHRLVSLSAFGVRQAVVRPLIRARIAYEERFVDRVVDELAAFDFDPPLLQIVCGEVYDDAVRDARGRGEPTIELRAAHIERGGGIRGALARYVARVSAALAGDDRLLACAVLDALTTAENTKRTLRFADLLTEPAIEAEAEPRAPAGAGFYLRATPEELRRVLDRLCRARLVRMVHREAPPSAEPSASEGASDEWYELLHDRLVPVVKDWLDAEPAFDRFRFAKKLIASLSAGRTWRDNPGGLLSAAQLVQQVAPHAQRLQLTADEAEYVLRSAIYGHAALVPTVAPFYDAAAGAESSAALVTELAAHPDFTVRCSAARAIVHVATSDNDLRGLCARLALEDPVEDVRRAAGRALASIAGDAELAGIAAALNQPRTRRRALQVVTDLVQLGRPVHRFPLAVRLAARWYRKRRIYREHRERIRDRASIGALHALAAAAVFALVAGIPCMAMLAFRTNPATVTRNWPIDGLVAVASSEAAVLAVALLLGALLGWRGAAHLASREALGGQTGAWSGSAVRGATPAAIVCVLLFGALGIGVGAHDQLPEAAVLAVVLAGLWWQVGPLAVRWVCRTIAPRSTLLRAAIWSTVAAAGMASAATAVFASLLSLLGVHPMVMLVVLLFLVVGLNLCVAAVVQHAGTQRLPIAELPAISDRARRRTRWVAIALVLGVPLVSVVIAAPGLTPLVPVRVALGDRSEVDVPIESGRAQLSYVRAEVKYSSVVWFEASRQSSLVIDGDDTREARVVRGPGGSVLAASDANGLRVRATPIHHLGDAPPATSGWSYVWATVGQFAPGVYHGQLSGTTADAPSCDEAATGSAAGSARTRPRTRIALQLVWPASDYDCVENRARVRCADQHPGPVTAEFDRSLEWTACPTGAWSAEFDFDAPSGATSKIAQILVGYRRND